MTTGTQTKAVEIPQRRQTALCRLCRELRITIIKCHAVIISVIKGWLGELVVITECLLNPRVLYLRIYSEWYYLLYLRIYNECVLFIIKTGSLIFFTKCGPSEGGDGSK